jgi:SAM-dependent methyltransferase
MATTELPELLLLARRVLSPARLEEAGIRRQVRAFASQLSGRCLDAGCRSKPYFADLAPYVQQHYGIDMARPRRAAPHGPDVLGSITSLPFQDSTLDCILCTQVLDDVPEPKDALREFARVLRPRGVLLLTVPQSWGEHDLPHDYWRFTEGGLRYLLRQSGFEVDTVTRRGGVGTVAMQRLSVFVYYTFGRNTFLPWRAAVVVFCGALQLLGQVIDMFDKQCTDTLGYAVLARRVDPHPGSRHA